MQLPDDGFMTDVLPDVQRVAAEVFNTDITAINAQSSPDTLEQWDSIQHLSFVMALEGCFNVEFSPEDMERIKSVGDAAHVVAAKLQRP